MTDDERKRIASLVADTAAAGDNGSFGLPYSAGELALAAAQPVDEYHRHLMEWAAKRLLAIESLAKQIRDGIHG